MAKNGIKNDLLNLIYESSKSVNISIKTPVGNSEESEVEDIVMQGESISSIMCTNSMDVVSKDCKETLYKYREELDIPKLGYVDDLIDVQKCGDETKAMNEYTNDAKNKRKLQFNGDKSHRMHIGEDKVCESVYIESWKEEKENVDGKVLLKDVHEGKEFIKTVDEQIYLGEILDCNGRNKKNIENKMKKGKGVINEIVMILENVYFGSNYFEALKIMRESLLISVVTTQSEVWINTTEKELQML